MWVTPLPYQQSATHAGSSALCTTLRSDPISSRVPREQRFQPWLRWFPQAALITQAAAPRSPSIQVNGGCVLSLSYER